LLFPIGRKETNLFPWTKKCTKGDPPLKSLSTGSSNIEGWRQDMTKLKNPTTLWSQSDALESPSDFENTP